MRIYKIRIKHVSLLLILSIFLVSCGGDRYVDTSPFTIPEGDIRVSFAVTADMREYTEAGGFQDVCERISWGGPGDFMISRGDIDPPGQVYNTIVSCLGADYIWYPVVGNYESETSSDMTWLRSFNTGGDSLPGIVNTGPEGTIETTYSFDYENAHFVILNEYYDGGTAVGSDAGSDGDVVSELRTWLEDNLQASAQPVTIVIGHEPAFRCPTRRAAGSGMKTTRLTVIPKTEITSGTFCKRRVLKHTSAATLTITAAPSSKESGRSTSVTPEVSSTQAPAVPS
jgi:hypothetical protein